MPYKNPQRDRNYAQEYANYDGTAEVKKRRAERNKARRIMVKEGLVAPGDGKDVNHIQPLTKGGTTTRKNLNVQTAHNNRSFDRTKTHKVK